MATIEMELRELKRRVERLEWVVQEISEERLRPPEPDMEGLSERERLLAELKAEGLIRDLLPEERALAAQWDALPEEEKQAIMWEMHHLKPGPMLSDIVIENRR